MKKKIILMCAMLLITSMATAKKMYKWVDEDGRVHYSDKVPPNHVKQAREELNKEGVIVGKVDRAKTKEELAIEAEALKLAEENAEKERLAQENDSKERTKILKSYVSEEQIMQIKQERIEALTRNIEMANENLEIQKSNHQDLLKRAADKERNGEVVSQAFLGQIDTVKKQINYQEEYIRSKKEEKSQISTKYDSDLKKYQKYTGKTTQMTAQSEDGNE
ncbi:DUF4124 domain-containing protein [Marinicella sp. W31]|uniref:DUF4124 domain-containing protein n=1 Tax=Marinicella sp. W31 TaxID=3023713 RepID=UPI0037580DBB